jgi:hypothetical protein
MTAATERSADFMTDFDMLNVLTLAFGPGRNMKVKYSFFLIFRDFLAFIIPPEKKAHTTA